MSEYENIYKTIRKYLPRNNTNWFNHIKKFEDQGKQGTTGLIDFKGNKVVYKTSQTFNHIIQHEYSIMKSLKDIHECCPHFARPYGILNHKSDFDYKYKSNLFDVQRQKCINNQTLLLEYINGIDLTEYIENDDDDFFDDDVMYSVIKQILCALSISQQHKDFCHYDLHSSNILLTKCDPDLVILYILNEKNSIAVPTFGTFPRIIDFGFSYTKDLENKNFNATLAHTDVGFMSCTNDFISDLKLFLVTTSYDLHKYRKNTNSYTYRNIIRNLFKALDINWEAGWDNYSRSGATDRLIEEVEDFYDGSELFEKYDYYCVDLFQSLIKLPMREKPFKNIEKSFKAFVQEFKKIEAHISSNIINLYILKNILDIAKSLKSQYVKNYKETSLQFKIRVLSLIDSIISFFNPKNINFERLLCSIYVFSDNAEGFLFNEISIKIKEQNRNYSKIPLKTPSQVFGCIESNIPHTYKFNSNTKLLILDSVHNNNHTLTNIPPFIINVINKSHHLSQGNILFDYITNKLDDDITKYDNIDNHIHNSASIIQNAYKTYLSNKPIVIEPTPLSPPPTEPTPPPTPPSEPTPTPEPPKKKRGRPKKIVTEVVDKPKRKRGRPKKSEL